MARGILLDTSAWIGYLRPHGWGDLKAAVQQALRAEPVYTGWVVTAELLIGARDEPSVAELCDTLRVLPEIPLTPQLWEAVARLGYTLRRQGVTIPLPDVVSAQAAIAGDLVLWHVDEHFEHVRRLTPLQTRSVVPEFGGGQDRRDPAAPPHQGSPPPSTTCCRAIHEGGNSRRGWATGRWRSSWDSWLDWAVP
jgi:hypothetical protein